MKIAIHILSAIIVAGMTAWGTGAIYYSPLPGPLLRSVLAGGFVVATIFAFLLFPRRRRTLAGFLLSLQSSLRCFFKYRRRTIATGSLK